MRTNLKIVIVAGSALAVILLVSGLLYFRSDFDVRVKDLVLEQINEIGVLADEYYSKPFEAGGGNASYSGFEITAEIAGKFTEFKCQVMTRDQMILFRLESTSDEYQGKPYSFLAHYVTDGLKVLYLYEPSELKWKKLYDRRWHVPDEDNEDHSEVQ